jgi:hypothetical protein
LLLNRSISRSFLFFQMSYTPVGHRQRMRRRGPKQSLERGQLRSKRDLLKRPINTCLTQAEEAKKRAEAKQALIDKKLKKMQKSGAWNIAGSACEAWDWFQVFCLCCFFISWDWFQTV